MTCPRCGLLDVEVPACPRCGVVFAKLQSPRPRPVFRPVAPSSPPPRPSSGYGALVTPLLIVALAIMALALWHRRQPATTPAAETAPRQSTGGTAAPTPDLPPPTLPAAAPPPPVVTVEAGQIAEADIRRANELAARLMARASLGPGDVQAAEELFTRYPGERTPRDLLAAVLLAVGRAEQRARRFPEAAPRFRRACEVQQDSTAPRLALMDLLLATSDWAGAEAAAREALALEASDLEALHGLGFALFRQDRNREAADVLRTALGTRETAEARALLDRIEKGMRDEQGMTEQRISHFNVRYDGDAHEDVGREILRALERHYATLVTTFDHQPQATIPVILFSRQQYYDAAGAPAWSGGVYDNLDGRVRIPIGGLTAALTPDIDEVLIHEVTHAFIADRSRGLAPREIHEGLAQYMEGKRLASMLNADQLRALADGRGRGVYASYMQALSFVEYLMGLRGQGGMNDLLKAMGETGDVNEAFRRVHGQGYPSIQRAWMERVRQQYGS